ncbi:MAG: NUDIX hydrolase [Gemmatimonadaceae bacterium]|jgi:8-oxo-dGTP pyrophosphatase MutT (NUDIX family)
MSAVSTGEQDWRVVPPARERRGRGEPAPRRVPTKTSFGVVLCRQRAPGGALEVLLVRKRYTYAFAEFVHGKYSKKNNHHFRNVATLLNRMTPEELLQIWSLDFSQMWYHIWLTREKGDLYNRQYSKFQSAFMRDDAGKGLRRAIQAARPGGAVLWEVPKGRRQSLREPDVLCAIRELREEAGVERKDYRLLPGVRRRVVYVSDGTRYENVFFVAVANPHLTADDPGGPDRPVFREIRNMAEVSEIRWYNIEQLRLLEIGPVRHLETLVAPAFRLAKCFLHGRWAFRRGAAWAPAPSPTLFLRESHECDHKCDHSCEHSCEHEQCDCEHEDADL